MSASILNQVASELSELQGQLNQFKSSVEYLNSAKGSVSDAIHAVLQAEDYHMRKLHEIEAVYNIFRGVVDTVQQLSSKIDSVNFPERLTSINDGVYQIIKEV